jgi:thiamine kinase-like enzyme
LRIIDFEYAGLNYRAFDLGNLSCEFTFEYSLPVYPGFQFEKSEYPANEQQSELFEAYARGWRAEAARRPWIAAADASAGTRARARAAEALASVPEDSAAAAERWARTSTSPAAVDAVVGRSSSGGGGVAQPGAAAGPPDSDDLVRRLVVEARLGMLASNFYWAAWAAVMANGRAAAAPAAATVFDYAAYGLVRAREFSRLKKQLLSLDDGAAAEAEAAAAAGEAAAAAAAATLAADC